MNKFNKCGEPKCICCGHEFEVGEAIFSVPGRPRCFYCANIGAGSVIYKRPVDEHCTVQGNMKLTKAQKERLWGLVQEARNHQALAESTLMIIELEKARISRVKLDHKEWEKRIEEMTSKEVSALLVDYYIKLGLEEVDCDTLD